MGDPARSTNSSLHKQLHAMVRVKHDPYDRQPTKEEFARTWQSTDPRDLAKEIATHGGECPEEWPERRTNLVDLPIDSAPQDVEELMVTTRWNPTLVWEMTTKTREVFLEVYLDDLHDCYSEVIESLQPPNRVTFDTLRKFKHLAVSLSFLAIADVCQAAFDAAEEEGGMDEFPEVDPDERPGLYCPLDVPEFTRLAACTAALTRIIYQAEKGALENGSDGEMEKMDEVMKRVVEVENKFAYDMEGRAQGVVDEATYDTLMQKV